MILPLSMNFCFNRNNITNSLFCFSLFYFSFVFSFKCIHVVASSPDNKSKVENIVESKINEHEPNINSSIDEKSVDITQGNPFLSTKTPLAAQQTPELNGLISSKSTSQLIVYLKTSIFI